MTTPRLQPAAMNTASPFEVASNEPPSLHKTSFYNRPGPKLALVAAASIAGVLLGMVMGFTARLSHPQSCDSSSLPPRPTSSPTYANTPEGQSMLSNMGASALMQAYHTPVQINQANCGLASSASVLNSLRSSLEGERIDEGEVESAPDIYEATQPEKDTLVYLFLTSPRPNSPQRRTRTPICPTSTTRRSLSGQSRASSPASSRQIFSMAL